MTYQGNIALYSLIIAVVGSMTVASCSGQKPQPSARVEPGTAQSTRVQPQASAKPGSESPTLVADTSTGAATLEPAAESDRLPPLSYMCPMPKDADVLLDAPGKCPKCGMTLKPVRIVLAYSCLNNTAFIQEKPGKCRTNGTDLVPISASMFWVCPESPDDHLLTPSKCADGSDPVKKFELRPHGDHNPRHGGQFFMADDAWHHLEGTYPRAGLFRVFFYDDWTKPLAPKGFTGHAIVRDASGKQLASIPLKASRISNAMEARIPNGALPMIASLQVRFKPGEPEKLFDFQFNEYSQEPVKPVAPAPAAATVAAAPAPSPAPLSPNAPADVPASTGALPVQTLTTDLRAAPAIIREEPIPPTTAEILTELNAKSDELASEIENRAPLGQLWVPALRTKSLAVALVTDHLNEVNPDQRIAAQNAANRLLRSAYAIDNFGDLGDRTRILAAHEVFVSAVNDLNAVYGENH